VKVLVVAEQRMTETGNRDPFLHFQRQAQFDSAPSQQSTFVRVVTNPNLRGRSVLWIAVRAGVLDEWPFSQSVTPPAESSDPQSKDWTCPSMSGERALY